MLHLLRRLFSEPMRQKLEALLPAWQLYYIGGPETLPPPLTGEEERSVFVSLRDPAPEKGAWARQQLIVHNLRLVVYIARKFENTGVGIEDLTSIGTIGLIKAVGTFSPERGIKLATYASRCIENEILMFLRKTAPLKGEISLDEPLNVDWDGNELLLSDILGSTADTVECGMEQACERSCLREAVGRLPGRERLIMELRFGLTGKRPLTQKEVADRVGISQSYISRLEKKILLKLAEALREE